MNIQKKPKAQVGYLILTTDEEIIGYEDEGFESQLCIVRRVVDRAPEISTDSPRRFTYFVTTVSDGREVELFGDEFEVPEEPHT